MDEKREVDIRFYEDWDKNEKFVQQCLNEEKEWLKTLESFAYRKFVDWDWKKTFNSIEEAMEFLLGHCENNRQLWVLTLRQNRDLLKILQNVNHKIKKEMLINARTKNIKKPN